MTSQRLLRILLVLALVVANLAWPLAQGQNQNTATAQSSDLAEKIANIEKTIEERRKELGVPGVAVAVVKDDKVIFQKGFGLRDIERNLPVTADTLFAIGSCSKAFTAMAAVISADEGKLSLDDPPKKHLAYFKLQDPEADAKITVRDLLHHSSGLDRTDFTWYTGVLSREEAIRVSVLAKPTAKFREKFQYQNNMYSAAGEVVARANNTTWENYIAARFFKPLGMRSSDTSVKVMAKAADHATGYGLQDKVATKAILRDLTNIAPAGAINSNVKDMSQWVRLMLGGGIFEGKRFVSEKGYTEIVKKHISMGGNNGYGLGWALNEWNGRQVISHGGGIDGFNSLVALLPDQKLGLVVLTNVSGSALPARIRDAVFNNIVGKPEMAAAKTGAVPPQNETSKKDVTTASLPQYKELIGKYELSGTTLEITTKDDKVVLVVPGQPAYTMVEKEKDVFGAVELPDTYRAMIKRSAAGEITGFLLKQPEGEFDVKRLPGQPTASTAEITIDDLMAKAIAAAGGEANLRKHKSMRTTAALDFENQGLTGENAAYAQAPNLAATTITLVGLGKKLGAMRSYFDGAQGGSEVSFGQAEVFKDKQLEDARIASDFYESLNWKSLFKTVTIKEKSKLGDEEVYVVVKTPEKGNTVTDYISAKSFLLLKRDRTRNVGAGQGTVVTSESYSDYRNVDGVMIPFSSVTQHPSMGRIVGKVKEVKFDVDIPAAAFRASAK